MARSVTKTGSVITPDVVSKICSLIAVAPAKIRQALGIVVPTLAGTECYAAFTLGACKLFNLINDTRRPGDFYFNVPRLLSTGGLLKAGSGLMSTLRGQDWCVSHSGRLTDSS